MSRLTACIGSLLFFTTAEAAVLVAEVRVATVPGCLHAGRRLTLGDLGSGRGVEAFVTVTDPLVDRATHGVSFATATPVVSRDVWRDGYAEEHRLVQLDGDAVPELLRWDTTTLSMTLARVQEGWFPESLAHWSGTWADPLVIDLDGASGPEVMYSPHGLESGAHFPVFQRDAAGDWQVVRTAESLGALMADYDGDGRPESYRAGAVAGTWTLHRVQADLSLSPPIATRAALTDLWLRAVGDVDGDGRADLVNWAEDGRLTVRFGTADASLSAELPIGRFPHTEQPNDGHQRHSALGTSAGPLLLAEVDGSSGLEVLIDDGNMVRILDADSAWPVIYKAEWGGASDNRSLAVTDVDGDGHADLVRADCLQAGASDTRVEAHLLTPSRSGGGGSIAFWSLLMLVPLAWRRRTP